MESENDMTLVRRIVTFFKSYKYQIVVPIALVLGGLVAFMVLTDSLPFDLTQLFGEFRMFRYIAF